MRSETHPCRRPFSGGMDRTVRFAASESSNRFDELQRVRAQKRTEIEAYEHAHGRRLLTPECEDMCPEFERHERELHLDLHPFEVRVRASGTPGDYAKIDHDKAVKKYHRPAAGNEAPLPEDIRTPKALSRTLAYLFTDILNNKQAPFADIHSFLRDRTRSIRQDLTLQGLRDARAIALHEPIARFHILSGNALVESDPSEFDAFQNTEQLKKVMQSLHEMYSDGHKADPQVRFENEDEFRGYYILCHLPDTNVFKHTLGLREEVFQSPSVRFAVGAAAAYHQSDYVRYVGLMRAGDYFQAALLHTHLTAVRTRALEIISGSYSTGESFSFGDYCRLMAFEDTEEAAGFLAAHGQQLLDDRITFSSVERPPEPIKLKGLRMIEDKRQGHSPSGLLLERLGPKAVDVQTAAAFKAKASSQIYDALVAYCLPIIAWPIVCSSVAENARETRSLATAYKSRVLATLASLVVESAAEALLFDVVGSEYQAAVLSHRERLRSGHQGRLRQLVLDAIVDAVVGVELERLASETCAKAEREQSQTRRVCLAEELRVHQQQRSLSAARTARTLIARRSPESHRPFAINRTTVDLDRLLPNGKVVWLLGSAAERFRSASGRLRVDTSQAIEQCPHLAICDTEQEVGAKGRLEKFPWAVPVILTDAVDTYSHLPFADIEPLVPLTVNDLLDDLRGRGLRAECTEEYNGKIEAFIQRAVTFLFDTDVYRVAHPEASTVTGVYPASLVRVYSQLESLLLGVRSRTTDTVRSMPRSYARSSLDSPAVGKVRQLLSLVEESRRDSAKFDERLLQSLL